MTSSRRPEGWLDGQPSTRPEGRTATDQPMNGSIASTVRVTEASVSVYQLDRTRAAEPAAGGER